MMMEANPPVVQVDPPCDGTVIFATGNVVYRESISEDDADGCLTGVEGFSGLMFFDAEAGEWLWVESRMTVRQEYRDALFFHWWTVWR